MGVGQAAASSWSRTFLPESRSSSAMSWRLRRIGASRSCQSGPRSVKRASGLESRCQAMTNSELPTATRARCLPRQGLLGESDRSITHMGSSCQLGHWYDISYSDESVA